MGRTFSCGHLRTTQNIYRYGERYDADGYTRAAREMCRTCMSAKSKARYVPKPRVKQDKPLKFKPCLLARVW